MLITALVIVLLLCALILSNIRPVLVFITAVGVLYITGEIQQAQILENITNTSVLTLILLMLSSLALEKTQLLSWLTAKVFHPSYNQTILRLGLSTAISSAFLNNTAVVATLMSSVQRNQEHPASRLLMPLSYFAILGGTLTLIGTSTNLVVNALLIDYDIPSLSFGAFFPVGALLLICVGLVVAFSVRRLKLVEKIAIEHEHYFLDAEVQPNSNLIGKSVYKNGLRALEGLFLTEIVRHDALISPVTPDAIIQAQDKLIFTGDVQQIKQLQQLDGVVVFADSSQLLESNLTEVIVSPESVLIGRTLKNTDFRSRFDAAVVAINREGHRLSGKLGEQKIHAGDKLVLAVGQDFYKRQNLSRNFFFLSGKEIQHPLTLKQNILAIGGFLSAILVSVVTPISLLESLTGYIVCMVLSQILDGTTIRRRFPFELWLILVCALCIAKAFADSGLANLITQQLFELLNGHNVYLALVVVFISTLILTEVITNTAAAAIILPIGITLAQAYQVDTLPFIMSVAYAASASFISPYGYQTNLMVMNAGGYSIKDFVKTGWKVSLAYSVVALIAIPIFFPF